jgi:hypothetical protein
LVYLDFEPAFAGKKLMEVRSTREILEKRIPILQDRAKRPFAEFTAAIKWLVVDSRYADPAFEIYRRRRQKVFDSVKAELEINLSDQQLTDRTAPIAACCYADIHEQLVASSRFTCSPNEMVRILTEIESAWQHIEKLTQTESELLADQSLDAIEEPIESSPPVYSTNRPPDPMVGVKYVVRRQLGFEGWELSGWIVILFSSAVS